MEKTQITQTALYVTFKLGDELFALDVSQVKEILDVTSITKVPQSESYMRGIINVRGSVIPVVDMKLKFGMAQTEADKDNRIVVVELSLEGETLMLGVMADSVHDVIEIEPDQIESPPSVGANLRSESIKGIGKRDDQFIIIIDINKVFGSEVLAFAGGEENAAELEQFLESTAAA
jgi:purine-binding chemotaxis protein CheW